MDAHARLRWATAHSLPSPPATSIGSPEGVVAKVPQTKYVRLSSLLRAAHDADLLSRLPEGRAAQSRSLWINALPYRSSMTGYPCSSPGCYNAATWAVLSEQPREGVTAEWGIWNYAGTLACDGHR